MRLSNGNLLGVGVTPSQYLQENPFTDISEKEIINHYILDMMGETI